MEQKIILMSKNLITYNPESSIPKYRQIVNSIKRGIERKVIRKGDRIPSINQICTQCSLSRDTVMLAYNELKSLGIISSKKGKGYFVESTEVGIAERVFLLFDELNAFKEDLYNAFLEGLNADASVDVFFHHFNYQVFKNLILESVGKYTTWVIMPASFDNIGHLLQKLPSGRVYILDRFKPELSKYPVIYQDFETDVYEGLKTISGLLGKYRRLVFIHPGGKEPAERVPGFKRYCLETRMDYKVVKSLVEITPLLYDVFLVLSDRTLVELIKQVRKMEFEIGVNFGILSFNDSILKEVVAGGITTLSTDFPQMGKRLADMILHRKGARLKNKSGVIVRSSL